MPMVRSFLLVVLILVGCGTARFDPEMQWISGDFDIIPVTGVLHSEIGRPLSKGRLLAVAVGQARELTGNDSLSEGELYYLTVAEYVGDSLPNGGLPAGIVFSIDVDKDRIAHISTFRLSNLRTSTEVVVLLSSRIPLEGVISTSQAAE